MTQNSSSLIQEKYIIVWLSLFRDPTIESGKCYQFFSARPQSRPLRHQLIQDQQRFGYID